MNNSISIESIKRKIIDIEYVKYVSVRGKILRWCLITLENGFTVSGDCSVCVDPLNDNEEIGKKVAYDNAFKNIWKLEGYLLQEQLFK